ncbi:MAG: hypothetical protein QOI21_2815 [Actinomycetota bacterium]|nr:hypothetical protein [Actinomycetota bacterium]
MFIAQQPQQPDYRWTHPELVRKINNRFPVLGMVAIAAAFSLGTGAWYWGNKLPVVADDPFLGFVLIAGGASHFCLMLSGAAILGATKCVVNGYLEINSASRTRALLLAMAICGLVFCAFAVGLLAVLSNSKAAFGLETVLYMVMVAGGVVYAASNYFVARGLLRYSTGPNTWSR